MSNNNSFSFSKLMKNTNKNVNKIISNNTSTSSSSSFMSGTLIIFIIIGLLILVYLYTTIRGYNSFINNSPMLIQDTVDGTNPLRIDAYKLPNSSDGKYGTEFSYSFWIYIKDNNFVAHTTNILCMAEGTDKNPSDEETTLDIAGVSYDKIDFKHIFHKGSGDMYVGTGDSYRNFPLLQSPGVWLYPNENKLNIRFNTYNNIVETCDVGNIPINKWVHISVILMGNSVDVYVNCNLKKRQKLSGVPKLNDGDLYINNFGGFNGYLSRFRYYNYAIDPFELDLICKMGPSENIPLTDLGSGAGKGQSYLSPNYWFNYAFPQNASYPKDSTETV
jgi:hypothetical protein